MFYHYRSIDNRNSWLSQIISESIAPVHDLGLQVHSWMKITWKRWKILHKYKKWQCQYNLQNWQNILGVYTEVYSNKGGCAWNYKHLQTASQLFTLSVYSHSWKEILKIGKMRQNLSEISTALYKRSLIHKLCLYMWDCLSFF